MSAAGPLVHVLDIPIFAIGKEGNILFPNLEHKAGHTVVTWGSGHLGEDAILGAEAGAPVYFTLHGFTMLVVTMVLLFGAIRAARSIQAVPQKGRGWWPKLFETMVVFVRDDIAKPNLGHGAKKYTPLILTFFFTILFLNLWGMIPVPITGTATGNINVTGAFAVIVLVLLFVLGIKEQGAGKFVKNLVPSGVPVLLLPLLYPLELISPVTKCFALAVRLFANMLAGHVVLATMAGFAFTATGEVDWFMVTPVYLVSIAFDLLEIFVAFLQAYVFTLLSALFLGSFIHPDH